MRSLFCFTEVGQQSLAHTHAYTHCLFLFPLAWRGYVARQNLKQIKKEQEEAAVRIQSGKEMFKFSSSNIQVETSGISHAAPCPVEIRATVFIHFQKETG